MFLYFIAITKRSWVFSCS